MASKKKKSIVELTDHEITFSLDDDLARVLAFNPNTMTVHINIYHNDQLIRTDQSFPFAHLPKTIKKAIKPI